MTETTFTTLIPIAGVSLITSAMCSLLEATLSSPRAAMLETASTMDPTVRGPAHLESETGRLEAEPAILNLKRPAIPTCASVECMLAPRA